MGLQDYIRANEQAASDINPTLSFFPVLQGRNEQILEIEAHKLHDFSKHTFKLRPDSDPYIISLRESIREHGILEPLLVRPHPNKVGEYEIIAGHTRKYIGLEVDKVTFPCIIKQLSDDDAIIQMGESNLQRPDWLPSEKAKTYAAHLQATRRKTGITQGNRVDLTSGTGFPKLRTRDEAARLWGISGKALEMYIKLNDLLPEVLELIDSKRISVKAGYQLSFLSNENQRYILSMLHEYPQKRLSNSAAKELRQAAEKSCHLTHSYLLRVFGIQSGKTVGQNINISFSSSELLNHKTTRTALSDPDVLKSIEAIITSYAKKHGLPLR